MVCQHDYKLLCAFLGIKNLTGREDIKVRLQLPRNSSI